MDKIRKAVLVYQGGIANVFAVDRLTTAVLGRNARRLLQADFRTCAAFARGMGAAGATVRTMFCNMAGDIAEQPWTSDIDGQPFVSDSDAVYVG